MPFTKMARGESAEYRAQDERTAQHRRGWYETRVPIDVLVELDIDYDVSPPHVYAPVWVHGIWLTAGADVPSDILKALLEKGRDELKERELVCTELSLNMGVPRVVRATAEAYADLVRQAVEKRSTDVPDP
jgi:hypothetical protein